MKIGKKDHARRVERQRFDHGIVVGFVQPISHLPPVSLAIFPHRDDKRSAHARVRQVKREGGR